MHRLFALLLFATACHGYYIPGVSSKTFKKGERVTMRVSKLTSIRTQLPYSYYWLPYPHPKKGIKEADEHGNLGTYLTGHDINNSPYELKMLTNEYCKMVERSMYTKEQMDQFRNAIKAEYHVNWIVDNLPNAAAVNDMDEQTQTTFYDVGFPVGQVWHGHTHLNNHVKIIISYHPPTKFGQDKGTIVGFLVEPISVKHKYSGKWTDEHGGDHLLTCYHNREMASMDSRRQGLRIDPKDSKYPFEVIWSYDVLWQESDIEWASRWDVYLSMADRYHDNVHWFSILNSTVVVLFLSGIVGLVLLRSLRKDITLYNQLLSEEERELLEESGWKLVGHDVFRAPAQSSSFCVLIGTGMQLVAMASVVIFGAAAGYLNPARRGSIAMGLLFIFILFGMLAGYTSGRMFKVLMKGLITTFIIVLSPSKLMGGKDWKNVIYRTAMFMPGTSFTVCFIANLFVWSAGSVKAVPFGSILVVVVLWFGVATPLVFVGAYMGIKQETIKLPVAVFPTPSEIPEQPWFLSLPLVMIMGGLLPFAAVYVELYFIFSSLWLNQYYYVFGFLLLIWLLLVFTCAEVAILFCYFQLNRENYNWWWRSFFTAGSTGIYIFLYGIYYFVTQMDALYLTTFVLYFCYMSLFSLAFFVACGTIGWLACFWFNLKIYAAIKVD